MCYRFVLYSNKEEIKKYYKLGNIFEIQENYNINISNNIFGIIKSQGENIGEEFYRGFEFEQNNNNNRIKIIKVGNARIESIKEKQLFSKYYNNHCLIIANGYYEWKEENGNKVPYYFYSNEKIIGLGGIYKTTIINGKEIKAVTIITRQATDEVKQIHDRMPLIISKKYVNEWLNNENNLEYYGNLDLGKYINFYQVSQLVNATKNNGNNLIKKVK